ncbi:MAG: diguanylate cyclase, partial [Firmicutes bacterium]|nr:diguanylate cyclase [Bacillota bacterium]
REQTTLSIAMLDLDFFKHYNDHYGHTAGDECLQAIAATINNALRRPADFCARYGGEEFVVILPNTDSDGAIKVLEAMRQSVMAQSMSHGFASTAATITVSIGYTSISPTNDINPTRAISTADKALYQAKLQGRNQIVFNAAPDNNPQ